MRYLLAALLSLSLGIGAANAQPLNAKDVRMLLALSGFNPGTQRALAEKGRHQLDYVKVTGRNGRFIVKIREHEVKAMTFGSLGVMSLATLSAIAPTGGPPSDFFQVTFGQLLEIASLATGIAIAIYHLGGKLQGVEGDVIELKTAMAKVDKAITDLAVTNNRLDMFDARLDDIVMGRIRINRYYERDPEPRRGRR